MFKSVLLLDLPVGEHQYKFYVDDTWTHDRKVWDRLLYIKAVDPDPGRKNLREKKEKMQGNYQGCRSRPEPPFLAGAEAVFFGPAPTPSPTLMSIFFTGT